MEVNHGPKNPQNRPSTPTSHFFAPPCNSEATRQGEDIRVNDRLLVERLAQSVNLSVSRFCSLFKAEEGVTPHQRIRQLRIKRAIEMAEDTDLRINQIIAEVGAGDESHFRRKFKKATGLTLTQYRRRYDLRATSENDGKKTTRSEIGPQIARSARK